ncbi:hypothetical protein ACHAXA_002142 [Cyclostephanos tholiformis]|uniref:DUF6824 domain-containing protein n=1 Tax=Cyclostephanos tholiformis TaxID=382380 RepID=A0ABD3RR54_9STRA
MAPSLMGMGNSVPVGHGGQVEIPKAVLHIGLEVLLGRGGGTISYPGNKQYRALVDSMKTHYLSPTTRKLEKTRIASSIVSVIRRFNPPGRILRKIHLHREFGTK